MTTSIDALRLRRTWGRHQWHIPVPFGPDGWSMTHKIEDSSVIVTCAEQDDGVDWIHASIAHSDEMPSYDDLVTLHRSIWGTNGFAYQCFVPVANHVNIHEYALHLWGRQDGKSALPWFGAGGSI
jgi:hypothetical protein